MDEDKALQLDSAESRRRLEAAVTAQSNVWGYTERGLEAKRAAMTMLSTKTGMYARIPLTCKAEGCPYSESCQLIAYDLAPLGELCPVETAQIEKRYFEYDRDFGLETSSFTDQCLVAEIINCEIMMERCKSLMAKDGLPVVEFISGMNDKGDTWSRQEVSLYWMAYEKASKKRNEAYQLMLATRSDKKDKGNKEKSLSELLAELSAEEDRKKKEEVIDAEHSECK
jgi:hypothetical protein